MDAHMQGSRAERAGGRACRSGRASGSGPRAAALTTARSLMHLMRSAVSVSSVLRTVAAATGVAGRHACANIWRARMAGAGRLKSLRAPPRRTCLQRPCMPGCCATHACRQPCLVHRYEHIMPIWFCAGHATVTAARALGQAHRKHTPIPTYPTNKHACTHAARRAPVGEALEGGGGSVEQLLEAVALVGLVQALVYVRLAVLGALALQLAARGRAGVEWWWWGLTGGRLHARCKDTTVYARDATTRRARGPRRAILAAAAK